MTYLDELAATEINSIRYFREFARLGYLTGKVTIEHSTVWKAQHDPHSSEPAPDGYVIQFGLHDQYSNAGYLRTARGSLRFIKSLDTCFSIIADIEQSTPQKKFNYSVSVFR